MTDTYIKQHMEQYGTNISEQMAVLISEQMPEDVKQMPEHMSEPKSDLIRCHNTFEKMCHI